jgi:probable F420-dependent oxidoreductase
MDLGVVMFATDESMAPDELARAAEDRGLASVWFPEHTHIPASRQSPYPGGGELPRSYYRTYDPFVALAAAAAVTATVRLGFGVCLVVERDPIVTAKAVASLDHLSGGRVDFGVGAGWNREEMANHGTDATTRFALLRERVAAMREIWAHDEASYHGRFVSFERIHSWPKPVQQPHPPIVVGGAGPSAIGRVVDYGDVWMPINRGDEARLARGIKELRERAEAAGRGHVPVWLYGASGRPEARERYAEMGVDQAIVMLPSAPALEIVPRLDRLVG